MFNNTSSDITFNLVNMKNQQSLPSALQGSLDSLKNTSNNIARTASTESKEMENAFLNKRKAQEVVDSVLDDTFTKKRPGVQQNILNNLPNFSNPMMAYNYFQQQLKYGMAAMNQTTASNTNNPIIPNLSQQQSSETDSGSNDIKDYESTSMKSEKKKEKLLSAKKKNSDKKPSKLSRKKGESQKTSEINEMDGSIADFTPEKEEEIVYGGRRLRIKEKFMKKNPIKLYENDKELMSELQDKIRQILKCQYVLIDEKRLFDLLNRNYGDMKMCLYRVRRNKKYYRDTLGLNEYAQFDEQINIDEDNAAAESPSQQKD